MHRYIIERDLPGIGGASEGDLQGAAKTSMTVLAELAPRVQWQHSYVAGDKTFCVYLAEDEEAIRAHAERSGFPATIITRVDRVIDPVTAG